MKRKLITAATVAVLFSAAASAQMGPGMMGGYGPGGGGGYGPGYRMGPGMMWGYGPGAGYGPGYGMGPRMMGGYGPGMMWGYGGGGYGGLNLSDEQRAKFAAIQEEFSRKQWDLMSTMHEQRYRLYALDSSDDAVARKAYQAMTDAQKAMFENSLDARKRMDAVLTKEQREQLKRYWRGG